MTITRKLLQELRDERDALCHQIGVQKENGISADDLIARCKSLSEQIKSMEQEPARPARGMSAPSRFTCQAATTTAAVASLRDEWQTLAEGCPTTHPFAMWEWADGWYRAYQDAGDILCLHVRDSSSHLMGVAPLYMPRHSGTGLQPGEIGFAGTYGRAWSLYPEFLSVPEHDARVLEAIFSYLHATQLPWQALKLLRVRADGPLFAGVMGQAASHGFRAYARPGLRTCVGALPDDPENIVSQLPSGHLRARYRHESRLFHDAFPEARFGMVETHDELAHALAAMTALSIDQWKERCRGSNFTECGFAACLDHTLHNFLESGHLRLMTLEVGDELVGAMAAVLYRGCLYTIQPAANRAYASYGPDRLVQMETLKQAVREGARSCDLMVYYPYKAQYVSGMTQLVDLTLVPDSARGTWKVAMELLDRSARLTVKQILRRRHEACLGCGHLTSETT